MKICLVIGICFLTLAQGTVIDFGSKSKSGQRIPCGIDDPNCSKEDKMNDNDAYCVMRMIKEIGNTRSPEYINAVNADSMLATSYKDEKVYRCMNEEDKDYWLDINEIRDSDTTVTSEYVYVP